MKIGLARQQDQAQTVSADAPWELENHIGAFFRTAEQTNTRFIKHRDPYIVATQILTMTLTPTLSQTSSHTLAVVSLSVCSSFSVVVCSSLQRADDARAVPLALLFLPTLASTPPSRGIDSTAEGEQCSVDPVVEGGSRNPTERRKVQVLPAVLASEAERALKTVEAGGDAVSTLRLLDSLLEAGQLERVPFMYSVGSGDLSLEVRGEEEEDKRSPEESLPITAANWDRSVLRLGSVTRSFPMLYPTHAVTCRQRL